MNRYYVKYKCEENKYKSTIQIMENYSENDIRILDWYISSNIGIIILESEKNTTHIKLKLRKYFNFSSLIDVEKIEPINDWLNNYEQNT